MQIWLRPIDDRFRPDSDVLVSPNCLGAREAEVELDTVRFPRPERLDGPAFVEGVSAICDRTARVWSARLNLRHNRRYSYGYWRILLMPWIVRIVMIVLRRDYELRAVVRAWGSEAANVEIAPDRWCWKPRDVAQINTELLPCTQFGFWIYSLFLRARVPAAWTLRECDFGDVLMRTEDPAAEEYRPFRRVLYHSGFSRWSWGVLELFCRSVPCPVRNRAAEGPAQQPHWLADDIFNAVLERALTATLPYALDDGFAGAERAALQRPARAGRLRLVSASALHALNASTFEIAHAFEAGERIVDIQHGAGYGIGAATPMLSEVEYAHHAFFTWGWRRQEGHRCPAEPLPMPPIVKRGMSDGRIVLVGTSMTVTQVRFNSEPESFQWFEYRQMKGRFVDALQPLTLKRLLYRPYSEAHNALADAVWMKRRFPQLPHAEGRLDDHLVRCALIVLDHPSTVLATALAMDLPTLCYWPPEHWPMCVSAKQDFDRLRSGGILFDTPEEAAAKLNGVAADIESWWQSPVVQQARKDWLKHHGQKSRGWLPAWLRALWKLSRGPRRILAGSLDIPVKSTP